MIDSRFILGSTQFELDEPQIYGGSKLVFQLSDISVLSRTEHLLFNLRLRLDLHMLGRFTHGRRDRPNPRY
jgi:hypothetical protein